MMLRAITGEFPMLILYCGELWQGGTCGMRMDALKSLGHTVIGVDTTFRPKGLHSLAIRGLRKLGYRTDFQRVNGQLLDAVRQHPVDLVWIDKGLATRPDTLTRIRRVRPGVQLVHYSPDDMEGRHNQTWQYLKSVPLYDLMVTTKSYNVPELHARGARSVLYVNNAYCRNTHRPLPITAEDRSRLGGPVGFIGAFEEDRAEAMRFLAENGVPVRIWGPGWQRWARRHPHANLRVEDRALWGEEYAKVICSFDINLGFLRKLNRDLQTTRSVEIPACGGFLLAERTPEHLELFDEGIQAEFFANSRELLEKCRYYRNHPDRRLEIAAAARERCIRSDYSYDAQMMSALHKLGGGSSELVSPPSVDVG